MPVTKKNASKSKQAGLTEAPLESPMRVPNSTLIRTLQGVNFQVLTQDEAVQLLDTYVSSQCATKVAIANAHTLNTARENAEYRELLKGFLVFNDGIGVDIASYIRYGKRFPSNLNGTDFLPAYLSKTSLRLRVFLLGAKPHVVERAYTEARRQYPAHEWLGFNDGYFRADDEEAICARINLLKPDILLVAMGNPLQEFWIDRCTPKLGPTVCIGVGAFFDFLSGEVDRAPHWLREIKFEWAYRLLKEPGRLWRRYLVGNLTFLWYSWRER